MYVGRVWLITSGLYLCLVLDLYTKTFSFFAHKGSGNPLFKISGMCDSQRCPEYLYLNKNEKYVVIFYLKMCWIVNFPSCLRGVHEKQQFKMIILYLCTYCCVGKYRVPQKYDTLMTTLNTIKLISIFPFFDSFSH